MDSEDAWAIRALSLTRPRPYPLPSPRHPARFGPLLLCLKVSGSLFVSISVTLATSQAGGGALATNGSVCPQRPEGALSRASGASGKNFFFFFGFFGWLGTKNRRDFEGWRPGSIPVFMRFWEGRISVKPRPVGLGPMISGLLRSLLAECFLRFSATTRYFSIRLDPTEQSETKTPAVMAGAWWPGR